jgi:hypothetical protein
MNWEAVGAIAESIGAASVIATLAYLALQIRSNTSALRAQTRYSISEFVLQISIFRAEHADRYAKLSLGGELTAGDLEFRYWSHMQLMLHAETYLHHFEIGLMPESHWSGYERYIDGYVESGGFREFWENAGPSFSLGFQEWIDGKLRNKNVS